MNRTYLLIGGNLGDRFRNLHLARKAIQQFVGNIQLFSGIYETAAWGKTDQPSFLNQVLLVLTTQSPRDLLNTILQIEKEMGRSRQEKYGPRLIDIDILLYNNEVIEEPQLTIPHPQLQLRRFALAPLQEIAPDLVHPLLIQKISELLTNCPDTLAVKKL